MNFFEIFKRKKKPMQSSDGFYDSSSNGLLWNGGFLQTLYQRFINPTKANITVTSESAFQLAHEIAENAPLAVMSVRATMRRGIADAVRASTDHEFAEQYRLQQTDDHREGLKAVAERRAGEFKGR